MAHGKLGKTKKKKMNKQSLYIAFNETFKR